MRIILAGIAGGIAMFIWSFVPILFCRSASRRQNAAERTPLIAALKLLTSVQP